MYKRQVAILTLVGAVDLPIIKFSVDWWNTLHQGSSVFRPVSYTHLDVYKRQVAQIADGVVVDRKEAAGRAVFRRHVTERRPVGDRQAGQARAEIFDEFADDAALAQYLRCLLYTSRCV